MNKPLTLDQAIRKCKNYQFLTGKPYDKDFPATTPIQAILVVPFNEQSQQHFIDDYDLMGYRDISGFPQEDGYEVVVLARYWHDREICLWMDIDSYVKNNSEILPTRRPRNTSKDRARVTI